MSGQRETHGYLALVQLLASAAVDARLRDWHRRALSALARYSGPDGTCCVSQVRLADLMGTKRQQLQKALRQLEACGYLASERRSRATGAEGAKVYTFNLDLQGAVACPVVWPKGVQLPEAAGGCNFQRLQGVQPSEAARKKPLQETNSEDTTACPPGGSFGIRLRAGKTAGMQEQQRARQTRLPLPIPSRSLVEARVADHNRDQRAASSGRMWKQWCELDPGLKLIDMIGVGADDVQERALAHEIQKRGRGCAYIAGAVERATRGEITARDILAGAYRSAS